MMLEIGLPAFNMYIQELFLHEKLSLLGFSWIDFPEV